MADETERAEERAAVREAAADAREIAAVAAVERAEERAAVREASADSRAQEMASVLPGIQAALDGLNQTMASLIERLDVAGTSNEEIGRWRKRATVAFVSTVALLVVGGIISSWAFWEAIRPRDETVKDFARTEVAQADRARVENCLAVQDAFGLYTDALTAAFSSSDRSPPRRSRPSRPEWPPSVPTWTPHSTPVPDDQ